MSKHRLSAAPLPPSKRLNVGGSPRRTIQGQGRLSRTSGDLDIGTLYDEIILFIFAHLDWVDLCRAQATNSNWARLANDNQLWKALYLNEYGRSRLRGARGFVGRADGREVRPLPGRAHQTQGIAVPKDWKWMFRISSNWRTGRCALEQLRQPESEAISPTAIDDTLQHILEQTHILLSGPLTITASSLPRLHPPIVLHTPSAGMIHTHTLFSGSPTRKVPLEITSLALDQAPPRSSAQSTSHNIYLASFLSTGEFTIFGISYANPSSSSRLLTYVPHARNQYWATRTSPIIQAVYHDPLLITLSEAFHLSLYRIDLSDGSGDLSDGSGSVHHTQTLTSFTSHPPSSLVLSSLPNTRPNGGYNYKLVMAYATPVYPAHWSVGATELVISGAGPPSDLDSLAVLTSRTISAFVIPSGWLDQAKMSIVRDQWERKVQSVGGVGTDGKWVIIASGHAAGSAVGSISLHSASHLQLYRLQLPTSHSSQQRAVASPSLSSLARPKLTFVRTLHGQTSPISALALSDGRCVSQGINGSIWVWDLESGTGAEVAGPTMSEELAENDLKGTVVFDERRVISAGTDGIQVRRFDI